jgi:small subunit ribosomal protein S16
MAATIRLKRMGRKKQPHYRIVVADESAPRDGPSIEMLGVYNPRTNPAALRVDAARALYWLNEGAKPSDTVRSLFRRAGIWKQFHDGVAPDAVEETIVYLGPQAGEDKTTQRVSGPPRKPKKKPVTAAALVAEATKAVAVEAPSAEVEVAAEPEAEAPAEEVEAEAVEVVAEAEAEPEAEAAAEPEAEAPAEEEAVEEAPEPEAEAEEEPVAEATEVEPEAEAEAAAEPAEAEAAEETAKEEEAKE